MGNLAKYVRPLTASRKVSGCPDADWCSASQRICAKASLKEAICVHGQDWQSLDTYVEKTSFQQ